jgi:hypothetical protein
MMFNRRSVFHTIPTQATVWTYRYENNDILERHGATLKELLYIAVDDLEQNRAIPICIKADGKQVLDTQDIAELWSLKYLEGQSLPY